MSFRILPSFARTLRPLTARPLPPQIRFYTAPSPKRYTFPEIRTLAASPRPSALLIDVREPGEFSAGAIPGAINLPIVTSPEALSLPADEFEDRFGFEKPRKDSEVVFYCKAGVRSAAAARIALAEGYEKVGEYPGSWLEWVEKKDA
ncbi:putative thiosulfate sulfurtransferase mitochondrial precursor [Sphaerosporella brunnea]|uniref:Sulfurtransferase n=1 Tax=Sphaerosporella brunnea TaxID=1250544 RepID=A0A5J5ESJ6_9PEZI|nr:putative thiosulfate sulfurtransferase mitochondrial precursor [Sphaerosporella brunnea]